MTTNKADLDTAEKVLAFAGIKAPEIDWSKFPHIHDEWTGWISVNEREYRVDKGRKVTPIGMAAK